MTVSSEYLVCDGGGFLSDKGMLEVCYFSCLRFFGVQVLMEHLRFPNVVRDVPMICRVILPSGSSKAKEIVESWLSLNESGLRIQVGS